MHYFLIKKLGDEKIATNSHAKYSQSQAPYGPKTVLLQRKKQRKTLHPEVHLYNVGRQGLYFGVWESVNLGGKNDFFEKIY